MKQPFIDPRAARFLEYLRRNYRNDRGAGIRETSPRGGQ